MTREIHFRAWRAHGCAALRAGIIAALASICGCVVAPAPPTAAPPTAVPPTAPPPIAAPPTAAPPPTVPVPAKPAPPSPGVVSPREPQARYERIAFDALPAAADLDWIAAWPAWLQSCSVLASREYWKEACSRAPAVDARSAASIRTYFARQFDVYRIRAMPPANESEPVSRDSGLVTGYYEPLLKGSRRASRRYRVPLYRVPNDLVVVELASVVPEVAGLRLRGRLQGQRVVPYPSRGEITASNALRGNELVWVDDPIDAFFLHVQGSGRIQLDDGTTIRLGYGEHNGHPYRSIGRWLVEQGELTLDQASMQGIKAWAALNPQRLSQLLEQNPSFVFFRELPLGDPAAGPKGALGVPLVAGISLAVDARYIPLGAAVLLASSHPATGAPFVRPMVAHDTGGAIRGPLRFDYFWGFGPDAGEIAGRQKHDGSAWLFAPKGASVETLLKR